MFTVASTVASTIDLPGKSLNEAVPDGGWRCLSRFMTRTRPGELENYADASASFLAQESATRICSNVG
jgi:hypothetical protein